MADRTSRRIVYLFTFDRPDVDILGARLQCGTVTVTVPVLLLPAASVLCTVIV